MQPLQNILETALLIISLMGIIYKVSQTETKLYLLIDSVKDSLMKAISQINLKLQVHIQTYEDHLKMTDYKINSLDQKIDRTQNKQ